jgi:hypothetical protein
VQDRYAALVKGPSVLFPRGFLWLIPVWFAGVALLLELKAKTPAWYGDAALGGLALAALTLLCVLATMRNNAFVADQAGIWLGLRAGAARRLGRKRRQLRQLPWPQIEQIQILPRSYGARLDVILSEAAPIVGWPGALRKIVTGGLLVILPVSYTVRTPGLLSPRSDPPSYRIPLYDVTVAELRLALAQLAPQAMPIIDVPRWRATAAARRRRARRSPSYPRPAAVPALMAPSRPAAVHAYSPTGVVAPPPAAVPPLAPADDQQETRGHMIA